MSCSNKKTEIIQVNQKRNQKLQFNQKQYSQNTVEHID